MFYCMTEPLYPVFDHRGRQIGTVQRVWLELQDAPLWRAVALDGCDLGSLEDRHDAHYAISDGWDAGRPRDPDLPRRLFRPMHAQTVGSAPLYLGY